MAILNDVVTEDEIRPIVEELYRVAGFHGSVFGYMKVHSDGEMTAEFSENEVEDANEEYLEDVDLAYNIVLVLSEQRFGHMLDLMDKYPDLKDEELEIRF